jgi:uncharacterized protein YgbK (DUF1537 family)
MRTDDIWHAIIQTMDGDRYVILDDDPTGTQAVHDVPVLLRWSAGDVRAALAGSPSVHLLTNARALAAEAAEEVTFNAARAARLAAPDARLVLRGDSTLRAHLLPEYRAVTRAAYGGRPPVLLLVPALPAAGRLTLAGIHYAASVPVHETDYARDGVFSYHSSRLLEWAEQRTDGLMPAQRGREVPLERLRKDGPDAVLAAVRATATRGAVAIVPDVETTDDLELIAAGARAAYEEGLPLLVRAAPAFAGVLTRTTATGLVAPPAAADGLLVVCGSYVERTTTQLEQLCAARGISPVEVDIGALLATTDVAAAEIGRAARAVEVELERHQVAVLATPRERPPGARSLDAGRRIATGIAAVLPAVAHLPSVILAKGGITSQVTLAEGLGCDRAYVMGPIANGVACWRVAAAGREFTYLIFPGNVGGDEHLADVVSLVVDR